MRRKDLTGMKFGRWTVLAWSDEKIAGRTTYKCVCECGTVKLCLACNLTSGNTLSCGCFSRETTSRIKKKHGKSKHKFYFAWRNMINRCTNPKERNHLRYRDKGVCQEWLDSKEKFFEWCEKQECEPSWQLDRINNDLGYSPDNCRFVDKMTNIHNKSSLMKNNKTGYEGIGLRKDGVFYVRVYSKLPPLNGKEYSKHGFNTIEEAVEARNEFIKKHNLPHRIQEVKR